MYIYENKVESFSELNSGYLKREFLHSSDKQAMPFKEAEQPVKRIVPLRLSTMPGRTCVFPLTEAT
jgi:hypothetical protein